MTAATAMYLLGASLSLCGESLSTTTGPNVRFILAPKQLTSQTGFALMGEAGEKLLRGSVSLGYQIGANQRLKMSVEQLSQKLTYCFAEEKTDRWVKQIAGGACYKYFLDDNWFDSIDVGGWYSNAQNETLTPFVVVSEASVRSFERKIAGAQAWHASMGTTVFPWSGCSLGLAAVYDHVDYRRRVLRGKTVAGAGFTVDLNQRLFKCLDINLRGDFLLPYHHGGGTLNWTVPTHYGDMVVGLYGDYTQGRHGLPNNTSCGVQINMAFGSGRFLSSFYGRCCFRDKTRPRQSLFEWIAEPAVLMPIVLAIEDKCSPPTAVRLPDVSVGLGPYTIDVSGAFQRAGCSVSTFNAAGLPFGASINPNTGVISGMNLGVFLAPFNVTVMGLCSCGSATSSFILTYESL